MRHQPPSRTWPLALWRNEVATAQVSQQVFDTVEAKALIVAREAGALNNSTYRELTKVDTLTASQALCRLRNAGLLAQKGRGSATYYVPTERLLDSGLSSNPEALSSESEGLSTKLGSLSTKADALSTNPEGLSAMRAEELATLLQRHSRYVRNNYLRPLMRDGRLAMTNPNEPSDPQQAYRAVAAHL